MRSAIAAGLIAAVLFTGGAIWLRFVIGGMYETQVKSEMDGERTFTDALKAAVLAGKPIPQIARQYEVVHSDGRILASGATMTESEQAIGRPVLPLPTDVDEGRILDWPGVPHEGTDRAFSWSPARVFVQTIRDPDGGLIAFYSFVPDRGATTISDLDRVLWPGVPAAAVLVVLVAWASASRALRPVEWIRLQATDISAQSLHQRVDVPIRRLGMSRLSIGVRAAIAAALISSGPLIGGVVWMRHAVDDFYNSRWIAEGEAAAAALDALTLTANVGNPVSESTRQAQTFLFEVVHSDGRVESSSALHEAERRNGGPLLPPPQTNSQPDWSVYSAYLRLDQDTMRYIQSLVPAMQGRLNVWNRESSTGPNSSAAIYVYELRSNPENPAAALDRVLWPGIPAAIVLIGLAAWFGTTRALRPVEQIRSQAAEISTKALDLRVPVPPTRDAISRLAVTLNETLDRLEKSVEVQRQFIADAAHELRSPIASLRTVLEVAADHPDKADWLAVVRDAVTDTQRLQGLAEDLLLLAKLDSAQPLVATEVDLSELATTHLTGNDRVHLHTNGPAPIQGDDTQLDRLLRNLIDNATRHAAKTITVTIRSTQDIVTLEVADDGPGIAPEDRERVFDRFTRLDEARDSDAGGAGLGLAIAREIAVRHGGTLKVGDQQPGAVFTAEFPLSQG